METSTPPTAMKISARTHWLIIVLGTAGLLAGCASYESRTMGNRSRFSGDFEIVENSTNRILTSKEMARLWVAVDQYLDKQGVVASGDYYVKVYLPAEQAGVSGDWLVVRFTRESDMRFSMLASYPSYSPTYSPYYSYNYYPYGYGGYSQLSFRYYDDFYYGNNYYFPRTTVYQQPRPRNHDTHEKDGNNNRPGLHYRPDNNGNQTTRPTTPLITRTRWNDSDRDQNPRSRSYTPDGTGNFTGRTRSQDQVSSTTGVTSATSSGDRIRPSGYTRIRENQSGTRTYTPRNEPRQGRSDTGNNRSSRSSETRSYSPPMSDSSSASSGSTSTYSAPATQSSSGASSSSGQNSNNDYQSYKRDQREN